MKLKYGLNPQQSASITTETPLPFTVVNGQLSFINVLDALNAWQLVREMRHALGRPAATSFKHVSPAGAAVAGPLDSTDIDISGVAIDARAVTSAYVRARDCDPRSSFGDFAAVSDAVDLELAQYLSRIVSDGIIAPSFDPGAVDILSRKKRGTYVILQGDADARPPALERRDVLGVTVEQARDDTPVTSALFDDTLSDSHIRDALLAMLTVRYTQSNSVAFVREGRTIGVGAGQQSRVDCTRLAASKAATWWARRHPTVASLDRPDGMTRQDHVNWQMRMIENDMTDYEAGEFSRAFSTEPDAFTADDRHTWPQALRGVTMASDGFLPFRDNVDHASRIGTARIVEPGGSIRSDVVAEACREHGIDLVRTGSRLFHH